MTISTLELAREVRDELGIDVREVLENVRDCSDDFEVENYRFIHEQAIDEIMQDELSCDEYMLGCFNADFLAGVLGIDQDVIEAMQSAEAFEAVGKLVISMGKLEELQEQYAGADGFGHHFSHYDGSEHELGDYIAFRVN